MTDALYALLPFVLALLTLALVLLLLARLLGEKRQPGATLSWVLMIVLIPYLGIPLYLLFGGRKLRTLQARKSPLHPPESVHERVATSFRPQFAGAYPATTGNAVRFPSDGDEAFAILLACIRNARVTIDIMTFILGRDEAGRHIVEALAARAREGLRVRLLLDGLGCFWSSGRFTDPLRAARGEVRTFLPVLPTQSRWSANLRNHRKIAVFDGFSAFIGGHNLADEYLGKGPSARRWVDFGAQIDGPAAAQLLAVFNADWAFATGTAPPPDPDPAAVPTPGSSTVQIMASGPDVEDDTLYESILSLVQEVDQSLCIVTPYFVPDEVLFRSLMVKARTGREIRLIVPARSNHPITDYARRHYLRELRRVGVDVLFYTGGMLHAKLLLADNRVGMIGSVNMDQRSLLVNFEIGAFLHSPADLRVMQEWVDRILRRCRRMDDIERREPGFVRELGEDLARLVAPLL